MKRMILGVAVVLILVLIWMKWFRNDPTTLVGNKFNFYPDAVMGVEWSLGDHQNVFSRPNRTAPWTPFVEPRMMQSKLIPLATVALTPMKVIENGLKIKIFFSSDNYWTGVYADGHFVWSEGLKKGLGFIVDKHLAPIFEEGAFAFDAHKWFWCSAHPTEMSVELNDHKFKIIKNGLKWNLINGNKKSELDPTQFEKWLGRSCTVNVDLIHDQKNYPFGMAMAEGHWAIKFDNGQKKEFTNKAGYWLIDDMHAIRSSQLDQSLLSLVGL